ncbi:MAG: ferrous iron transport protein B [Planctomycetes bacterium]|nr:ferrous iron transport protein B [Planctomycetota bacterium]
MSDASTSTRTDRHAVALIGNPNTGKSSLFTALTGTRQKVANYPGVTVEAKVGQTSYENTQLTIIDLPGTYSLAARSPDERVATDALLGRLDETPKPDGVIIVVDASSLDRNLYLATQVLEFGLPAVIALTMVDVAKSRGIAIDTAKLAQSVGVPVVEVNSPAGTGLDELKAVLHNALHHPGKVLKLEYPAEFARGVETLHARLMDLGVKLGYTPARPEAMRLVVEAAGPLMDECVSTGGKDFVDDFKRARELALGGQSAALIEAQARYGAIARWTREARTQEKREGATFSDRVDGVLTHKLWGTLIFAGLMAVIFLSIYSWAAPLMDGIEQAFAWLSTQVLALIPDDQKMLRSLVDKGIIGGVGGVLIFLPQILILFTFIAVLEDVGYMSRAAFLMDRLMSKFGLSGKSFIPLLGSFACNIPGMMGARVIEDRNTRLTTIFLAPFMSCSARLPVYTLMIAAFVPEGGWLPVGSAENPFYLINIQGLVLFAMYWVGVIFAIPTALVLKRGILKSKLTPFLMELPSYKWPRARNVAQVLWERGGSFVRRAGTIILAMAIIVWALGYFPHGDETEKKYDAEVETLSKNYTEAAVNFDPAKDKVSTLALIAQVNAAADERVAKIEQLPEEKREAPAAESKSKLEKDLAALHSRADFAQAEADFNQFKEFDEKKGVIEKARSGEHLRNSYLGRMGHAIEPAVAPLGWDWRIGVAAIASFPAREVVIGVMGTIFNLGDEEDETSDSLKDLLRNETGPDGRKLFGLATGLSVMVFFALCCQCGATLAVMRRETNSWRWPIASFLYMTGLAYVVTLLTYQVAHALGG